MWLSTPPRLDRTVDAAEASASNCRASGPESGVAGAQLELRLELRDRFDNIISTPSMDDERRVASSAKGLATDSIGFTDGQFTIAYTPVRAGMLVAAVMYDSASTRSSPIPIQISPAAMSPPDTVAIFDATAAVTAGRFAMVKLTLF